MRILIFGGGAVGLGMAGFLLAAGERVDIIARPATVRMLGSAGLTRTGIFGEFHCPAGEFGAFESAQQVSMRRYDYILVCTKSQDSRTAAGQITLINGATEGGIPIVLFQNGWGNAEIFAEFFPRACVFHARVITGFYRPSPERVEITVHAEPLAIGSLFHRDVSAVAPLARALTRGGMPCAVTDTIERDLWAKMLYNCALNPLGAIFQVPYGELAVSAHVRSIMDAIIDEIFSVLNATGYRTHWQTAAEYRALFYDRLVPVTAGHRSSMLRDIEAKRPTEIDALNGAVVRLAQAHGIAVPANKMIANMIGFLEGHGHQPKPALI